MDILQSLPNWINQCDGIFLFGYVSEQDRLDIINIVLDNRLSYERSIDSNYESGNIGVSDMEVSSLRIMKMKNRIFISNVEKLVNVSDSNHGRMVTQTLCESCISNKNCLILLCPMYKDLSPNVIGDYKYSKIFLYSSTVAVSLKNSVISVLKLRWGNISDFPPHGIKHILRDRKIDRILD